MKLSQTSLDYIRNVVSTADLVKIDSIIIEPNRVRGIDENHTVFILHETNVPDLEVGSIGINRMGVFTSRFDLGKSLSDFNVDAIVEGDDPKTSYARSLTMKAKGIKVEYRCANPSVLKAPRIVHDVVKYRIQINPEVLSMMQKGMAAMSTDTVTFIGAKEGVYIEMSDINADKLTYLITDVIHTLPSEDGEDDEDEIDFQYSFQLKTLLPLFKTNPIADIFFTVPEGMLKIVVNDLNVYVLSGA